MAYSSVGAKPSFYFGPINQDNTKLPEPVTANFSFSPVLGRQIPIVIGTGKVEGVPVIGGASTVTSVTGYTQVTLTTLQSLSDVGGVAWLNDDPFSRVALVPVQGASQVAAMGYVLAYDPFDLGYVLIRLEVNDEVVFDAEHGISATQKYRFYGGKQTSPDPITSKAIGANAGAWQNFAMVFLDGFPATSPPTVKAVLSNAASATGATAPIIWTGQTPNTFADTTGWYEAYDPTEGVIYHLFNYQDITGLTTVYLVVLDTQTLVERYRVPLDNSDIYAVPEPSTDVLQRPMILAIRGTGHVLIRFSRPGEVGYSRIYNAVTGAIVAEYQEPDTSTTLYWMAGTPFGSKYVFFGYNRFFSGDQHVHFAVADITHGSLEVSEGAIPFREPGVWGRQINSTISFFAATDDTSEVYEHIFNGDGWVSNLVYTDADAIEGLHFDPLTGYLVVTTDGLNVRYVNPDTGASVSTFSSGKNLFSTSAGERGGYERFWPRSGFALFVYQHGGTEDVVLLDIVAKTISTWSGTLPHGTEWLGAIFDQNQGVYYAFYGDDHWTRYGLPSALPGSITLQSLITKAMFLVGYSSGELTFDGNFVSPAYGYVIGSDTNIRTVLQNVADIYTFSFSDTGDGYYFKRPERDASFALDDAITTADLVFGDTEAVKSEDDATIRTVARVELDYISREQGYNSRPASFAMPAINNSIRTERYTSPLTLSDLDAQTFVTEKFFDLQAKRRTHAFSLTGKPTFLPGDVLTVPSGEVTYTVQIDSVAMDRNLTAEIAAIEFQTKVSTTITAVSSVGQELVPVNLATQYIHLDIPLFRYADDLEGTALRQYGVLAGRGQLNWSGGVLLMGDTASALASVLSQAPHQGVVGVCLDVLANPLDPFGTADTSTVTIRRTAGNGTLLVDKTEAEVLAGSNLAFVGRAGRWEGAGYKTVTDNGDGTYTLSGFAVRGYRGSEVYCSLHEVGDVFVMIDPTWLSSMSLPLADLYGTKFFEGVGAGQDPATGVVQKLAILGISETPYAPVNLNAAVASPNGLDLSCDYRSRLAAGLNPDNFGEAALAFEWDIYDGATYKRTLTSTTNSVHYASADVAADFGSDPPAEITFDVFMMSALDILVPGQTRVGAGRGYKARGHIILDSGFVPSFDSDVWSFDSIFISFDQE
jgi:hypothetical protein